VFVLSKRISFFICFENQSFKIIACQNICFFDKKVTNIMKIMIKIEMFWISPALWWYPLKSQTKPTKLRIKYKRFKFRSTSIIIHGIIPSLLFMKLKSGNEFNWDEIISSVRVMAWRTLNYFMFLLQISIFHWFTRIKIISKHGDTDLPYYCPNEIAFISFIILYEPQIILININQTLYPRHSKLECWYASIHF
jgi:hypothetical protein